MSELPNIGDIPRRRVPMHTQPSRVIDDEIFRAMEVLEGVIDYHQTKYHGMEGRYGALRMPIPREVQPFLHPNIQNEWDNRNYPMVRHMWAEAWMLYFSGFYDMEPSFATNVYTGNESDDIHDTP